jgi:hypothetical protein
MAQTIITGQLDRDGVTVIPSSGVTWDELGSSPYASWNNWTSWTNEPANIVVNEVIDAGSVAYRAPLITVFTQGTLTLVLDISSTGLFTGEQETITFTDTSFKTYPQGRYYRWRITVAPSVDEPVPSLTYSADISEVVFDQYLDDVAVPALPTDSSGYRLVSHNFGAIKHVQATTMQGEDYADFNYVLSAEGNIANARPDRTSLVTTTGTPSYVTSTLYPRFGKAIFLDGVNDSINIDNSTRSIISGSSTAGNFTIEFWFMIPSGSPAFSGASVRLAGLDFIDTTGDFEIYVGVADDINGNPLVSFQGAFGSPQIHENTPILANTWYHYSWSLEGLNIEAYINGVDGKAPTSVNTVPAISRIRFGRSTIVDSLYSSYYLDEVRISNNIRYPEPNYATQSVQPFSSDSNTTLLLHLNDNTDDDYSKTVGTEDYFYKQNGGTVTVENKNPLAIKVVDYNGDAWDGAVDLHLRGTPQIALVNNSVTTRN